MHCLPNTPTEMSGFTDGVAANMASFESPASWYVAYTRPKQENVAAMNLQQQGFRIYLPLYKVLTRQRKNAASLPDQHTVMISYEPMFPRYMFFQPSSPAQSISTARSTRGVNSIVSFGSSFTLVQSELLNAIREREQQQNEAKLNVAGPLQPGRRVRLRDPALSSLEGLVHSVSAKRVMVLMEILGRQKIVKLKHNQLELA